MKLEEAKKLFQGEWIAFRSSEEGDNLEGEVVLHHKDRRTFDKELLQEGLTEVYITFSGPPVPEGYIPELAGICGLLGLSFLRHFKTTINYKQGYLEIL